MRYCGREFSEKEINLIREMIKEDSKRTRTDISRLVCENFNWYKRDGGLKEMSCRVALLRMEKDGLIILPPPRTRNGNGKSYQKQRTLFTEPKPVKEIPAGAFGELDIEIVSKNNSALWNEYIDRYHYLGYKPLPGAQLRYIIRAQDEILALLGFGASAWTVMDRDKFIGWTHEKRKQRLHLVINNARFLILPWIRSRNLASKILSLLSKRLPDDWEERYNYRPVLLETFVEANRFDGACYKAANWRFVGITKGRGKLDVKNKYSLPEKYIFLYPLTKNFRHILNE